MSGSKRKAMDPALEEIIQLLTSCRECHSDTEESPKEKPEEVEETEEENRLLPERVTCDSTQRSRRLGTILWYTSGFR